MTWLALHADELGRGEIAHGRRSRFRSRARPLERRHALTCSQLGLVDDSRTRCVTEISSGSTRRRASSRARRDRSTRDTVIRDHGRRGASNLSRRRSSRHDELPRCRGHKCQRAPGPPRHEARPPWRRSTSDRSAEPVVVVAGRHHTVAQINGVVPVHLAGSHGRSSPGARMNHASSVPSSVKAGHPAPSVWETGRHRAYRVSRAFRKMIARAIGIGPSALL